MQSNNFIDISPPVSGFVYEDLGSSTCSLDVPIGDVWCLESIQAHQSKMLELGRNWKVVDNLIVHDSIKLGLPDASQYIRSYKESLYNLSICGIKVVCYNFMPVFFKLRTHYINEENQMPFSLFDPIALIAFELFLLERAERESAYNNYQLHLARSYFRKLDTVQRGILVDNVCRSVQGHYEISCDDLKRLLAKYDSICDEQITFNLRAFQREIVPLCEDLGIHLQFNNDNPCRHLLGLPSVSNEF